MSISPPVGPTLGDGWDVALAVVGSAGVWGALERGLQLFTWQGLARRCEAAGVSGDVRGWGGTQREARAIAAPQKEPVLGLLRSWRGLTPIAGSSQPLLSEPAPDGGPAASSCLQMLVQFLLPLHLLDADPKAPLTPASVVLVLGLKQHWPQAPAPIILGSGIWSRERPGLEEFLANGKTNRGLLPA